MEPNEIQEQSPETAESTEKSPVTVCDIQFRTGTKTAASAATTRSSRTRSLPRCAR